MLPYTSHSNLRNQLLIDRLTSDAVASLFVIRMTQYTNYFYKPEYECIFYIY